MIAETIEATLPASANGKPQQALCGGFITEHYGNRRGLHAIQLEINRALYMDERAMSES